VITAVGRRGPDCTEAKVFYVKLRQHKRFWPDMTLAEARFTIQNASLRTRYVCKGVGEMGLYTRAWVQLDQKWSSKTYLYKSCS
jgi:hypothetical protein